MEGNNNNNDRGRDRSRGASVDSPPSTTNVSTVSLHPEHTSASQIPSRNGRGTPSPSGRQAPTLRRVPHEVWRPSIRIRRSSAVVPGVNAQNNVSTPHISSNDTDNTPSNRRRSSSEPQRPPWVPPPGLNSDEGPPRVRHGSYIPDIIEEASPNGQGQARESYFAPENAGTKHPAPAPGALPYPGTNTGPQQLSNEEYESNLVDLLDLVDPEVSALTSLTNMQNSLFIPYLGNLFNRAPTYNLSRRPTNATEALSRRPTNLTELPIDEEPGAEEEAGKEKPYNSRPRPQSRDTGAFTLNEEISNPDDIPHYAVLPEGIELEGWTSEDKEELNDHVRHLMHSRREGFKRGMKGFGQYVRRPLGFFVTLYATLITLFGLAWVLFLIGWVNVGGKQSYLINVIDNVLVALFAIMGDGLAPFRAVDTYHMIFIAHYHHLTWRLRKEKALPKLEDHNDLPAILPEDIEDAIVEEEVSVLSPEQQKRLAHHQKKFNRSHTFYKPHETVTHHAFPLRLLVAIVVLLDCHSLLQISLGACTWGISYHVRPFALTTVILCCSITVNITAGVLISVGDHKTRKKDVLEKMFKQDLTKEAIHRMEKARRKEEEEENERLEAEKRGDLDFSKDNKDVNGDGKKSVELGRKSFDFARKSLDYKRKKAEKGKERGVGLSELNEDASGMDGTTMTGNSSSKESSS